MYSFTSNKLKFLFEDEDDMFKLPDDVSLNKEEVEYHTDGYENVDSLDNHFWDDWIRYERNGSHKHTNSVL